MRSHTPPRCQSRTRRQHVIPDPQPSSCGSIWQGMPLRRTNQMPMRHARSETRGRPPFGRFGGVGKNGSTRSHNGSGSSAAAIPIHATSPTRIRFRRFCFALLEEPVGPEALDLDLLMTSCSALSTIDHNGRSQSWDLARDLRHDVGDTLWTLHSSERSCWPCWRSRS